MPEIFDHTIDESTLQKEDFVVVTKSGALNTPVCVTLAPAVGPGELRTALLIGEFGGATDPPEAVRVVGDVMSDGKAGGAMNFRGAEATVIPLEAGPTLVWAEEVPKADWSSRGRGPNAGTICPASTTQVIRATWAG